MGRRAVSGALVIGVLALGLTTCDRGDGSGTGPVPVASVAVDPATDTLDVGATLPLTATPKDSAGNPLTDRPVVWSSSNDAIATVSDAGLVTGVGPGSATIRAESEGQIGRSIIIVEAAVPVANVSVTPPSGPIAIGASVQLIATLTDAEGNVLEGREIAWTSENEAVASVDDTGLVTGVAQGTATITATSEGVSGSTPVRVSPPAAVSLRGRWSAPFAWPIVAVHLHLLPNGKVLSWGKFGEPQVWNRATNTFTARPSASHVFCAGHSFLPDGRLLVAGGHIADDHGLPDANIFDPGSETWTRVESMARGRWYPTNTTLPNGEVLTLAGRDQNSAQVTTPEVWRAGGGWRALGNINLDLPYYPRMFVAPNGQVFYAGELRGTHYLDPSGAGTWTFVADRQHAERQYGSAVMYAPGKILYAGGGFNTITNTAEVIDLNRSSPSWRFTNPMQYARRHLNVTVLPNGSVLALGGTSGSGFNNPVGAVRVAEMWDPATEEWRTLASHDISRIYHSTAILLPDGRVLHTGSGDAADVPGGGTAPDQRNAEIFSPPYLYNPDGTAAARPTITTAPPTVGYGESFFVATPDAATITKVTLLRLGSVTHAFDMNQRFNQLDFVQAEGGLAVTSPAHARLAPPGHYMLFILNDRGVPSIAHIIQIR